MPNLYFDTVTLHPDGVTLPDGMHRTFADLEASSGTLRLYARRLTIESVPDRSLNIGAEHLKVTNANAFGGISGPRTVRIAAERIEGPVRITSRGRTGAPGAPGRNGKAARVISVVVDSSDPDIREPKLISAPTAGTDGGPGAQGGKGGVIQLWYTFIQQGATLTAPGGQGGPGGRGGDGGAGHPDLVADAADGAAGAAGPVGPAGTTEARPFSTAAELWHRWDREVAPDKAPFEWAEYRLRVAEFLFRCGTPADLSAATEHLMSLAKRDTAGSIPQRVAVLLQRLFEHVTYVGLPRDLDVTPDVGFVAQDLDRLYGFAVDLLRHGEQMARFDEVQEGFATQARLGATHAQNMLPAVADRIEQATAALDTAKSGSDIARGRVKNIDQKISELRTVISDEQEAGPLAMMEDIIKVGVAVGGVAVGVSTGIGAIAAVGAGFAAIQDAAAGAQSLFELVDEVKGEIGEQGKFVKSLKDVGKAGKSIYDLGSLTFELAGITSTHPDPKIRELAGLQREQLLLHKEVGLHTQMEKEAQLGINAAQSERTAINQNIAASNKVADDLLAKIRLKAEIVLEPLLASARHVLDVLGGHVFRTLRAREIYLAHDPDVVVRHDLGHLHPDVEQMLPLNERVRLLRQSVEARFLQIVEWSSLVGEMADADNLSRGPVTFWFSTTDPTMLATFRTTRALGFAIPVEELFEEDGSQLFEAKFDAATVILHGAKIPNGSGDSIKLRQLGRWAVRRRPNAQNTAGIVKEFVLPERESHLLCRAVAGGVEAELRGSQNPRAELPFSMWGRGVAGDYELADDGGIDLTGVTKVEIGFHTQALSTSSLGARAAEAQRQLRPLLGGPLLVPRPRPAIPVPPRGVQTYGYRYGVGSVAAVGAALV